MAEGSSNGQRPDSADAPLGATRALLLVSLAVLLASSTWFTGTAVHHTLAEVWHLSDAQSAWLTISVQAGFIVGTFFYALTNLSDLFNARHVFFWSALAGAACNAGFAWWSTGFWPALGLRFLTGVTLAGVYPVGMKLLATWFRSGLGWRLGLMVGALTLGTGAPHLVRGLGGNTLPWRSVVGAASGFALIGGLVVRTMVADGPYLGRRTPFDWRRMFSAFESRPLRCAAIGYFGHMWELYAFWSLLTFFVHASVAGRTMEDRSVSILAFATLGAGTLGCIGGGWLSRRLGERPVATVALATSGLLCIASPWLFASPSWLLIPLLLIWGVAVVADSPQFSALSARFAPSTSVGTTLTAQNGVGFLITAIAMQWTSWIAGIVGWKYAFVFLGLGPAAGLWALFRLRRWERETRTQEEKH